MQKLGKIESKWSLLINPKIKYKSIKYQLEQYTRKLKIGEPEGLDRAVYSRIDTLKQIRGHLEGKGKDPFKQIPNVDELLHAYRHDGLKWLPGLVTYWSHGKLLSLPRRFDFDEFEAINKANKGHEGFWVEEAR